MRTEGSAQTSGDLLRAPRVPILRIRLHLNCAVYTPLPSTAPRQPPSLFLQTRRWPGKALHPCCSCCAVCRGCPPKPSPTSPLPSPSLALPSSLPLLGARPLRPPPNPRDGRAGSAHAPGMRHTRNRRNLPPPPFSIAPAPGCPPFLQERQLFRVPHLPLEAFPEQPPPPARSPLCSKAGAPGVCGPTARRVPAQQCQGRGDSGTQACSQRHH